MSGVIVVRGRDAPRNELMGSGSVWERGVCVSVRPNKAGRVIIMMGGAIHAQGLSMLGITNAKLLLSHQLIIHVRS